LAKEVIGAGLDNPRVLSFRPVGGEKKKEGLSSGGREKEKLGSSDLIEKVHKLFRFARVGLGRRWIRTRGEEKRLKIVITKGEFMAWKALGNAGRGEFKEGEVQVCELRLYASIETCLTPFIEKEKGKRGNESMRE